MCKTQAVCDLQSATSKRVVAETSETHVAGDTIAGKEVQLDKQGTDRVLGMGKDEGCQVTWQEQGLMLTCGHQGAWAQAGIPARAAGRGYALIPPWM